MTRMHLARHLYACAAVVLTCNSQVTAASSFNWEPTTHQVLQADFNHDGYADLLFQAKTAAQKHYLVPGESTVPLKFDYTKYIELPEKIDQLAWSEDQFKLIALQREKEGAALLAIAQNGSTAMLFQRIDNSSDLSKPTQKYNPNKNRWLRDIDSPDYQSGDFNGDGKIDLLQLDIARGRHQIILADKHQRFETAKKLSRAVQWGIRNNERLIIRDFNKDGQDDVFALSKDGKQPHVLLYSDGKGGFDKEDGKLIPAKQARLTWADLVSGVFPVTRNSDHQSMLFRVYNQTERTGQNKACLGWFFDPEMMIAKEYCPVVTRTNSTQSAAQPDGISISGCADELLDGGAVGLFQACPGHIVPNTPTTAPRFSLGVAIRGAPFTVSLTSTGDETALTYQLSAQDINGNILYLGAVASPMTQFPAKPAASITTIINTEGVFKLMYRSCNYNGCSGFGPSTTISVSQAVVTHTVTATATTGGSISPHTARVPHAQPTTFDLTAAAGFGISSVKGCDGKLSANKYTTGAVTADCEVTAEFTRLSYTLTSSTDGGGTISPTPSTTVFHGDTKTFVVTPGIGKEVKDIQGCNGKRDGLSYTTGPITSMCDVKATFKTKTFVVTAKAAANGTVDPAKKTVDYGQATTFVVTPSSGYSAKARGCDGKLVGFIYTTGQVTADCEVTAEFTRLSYILTSSTDGGGTISPTPSTTVFHGDTKTFVVTPGIGKEVQDIQGCNGKRDGLSYTTGPITSICDVKATFKTKTFVVTAKAAANGSIDPAKKTVDYGQTTTFVVTPDPGYSPAATGCGGKLVGAIYTTGAITADCPVNATFIAQAPTQTIYLHTDILGSVILETDANGNVKKRTEYKPFGESKDN